MNNFYKLLMLAAFTISANAMQGQLTGSRTIPSANYGSVRIAVDSINTYGVGAGGIIFNITPGHYEMTSGNIALLNYTTTSNSIVFKKNGAGANPIITAGTGTGTRDGILRIEGTDSVTIDGLELRDTITNTTATQMMEYGVAFFRNSATNGSNNCKVINCVIKLQKSNTNNSIGVSLTITNSTGATQTGTVVGYRASNLLIENDSISNVTSGIHLSNTGTPISPLYDDNVIIRNNNISNFGNTSSTYYGIRFDQCTNSSIYNNTIIGGTGNTVTCYGIYNTGNDSMTNTVRKNTITLTPSNTSSQVTAIIFASYSGAAGTLNVDSNTIQNCTMAAATTSNWYGIYLNSSTNFTNVINGNIFSNNKYGSTSTTSTGDFHAIYMAGANNTSSGSSITIAGNSITGHARYQSTIGAGFAYMIGMTVEALTVNIFNNTIQNDTMPSNSIFAGIYNTASSATVTRRIYNNTVKNIVRSNASTGEKYGIYFNSGSTSIDSVYNNTVSDWNTLGTGQFIGIGASSTGNKYFDRDSIYNITDSSTSTNYMLYCINGITNNVVIANNYIYNITSRANSFTHHNIFNSSGNAGTANSGRIDSNYINTLSFPNTTTGIVYGIQTTGHPYTYNIRNNTISSISYGGGSTVATGLFYGINPSGTNLTANSTLNVSNNSISSFTRSQSSPGSGVTYGIYGSNAGNIFNNVFNNTVQSINAPSNSDMAGIFLAGSSASIYKRIYNNVVKSFTRSTSTNGTTEGIYMSGTCLSDSVFNNTINTFTSIGTGVTYGIRSEGASTNKYVFNDSIYNITATGTINGISQANGTTCNYHRNIVSGLTSNTATTGVVNGISMTTGIAVNIFNNKVANLTAPSHTGFSVNSITGISISGGTAANVYYNTVYLNNTTNTGTTFGSAALFLSTTPTVYSINNILVNNSVQSGTGTTSACYRSSTVLTTHRDSSGYNLYYVSSVGTQRNLMFDGTTRSQTLLQLKTYFRTHAFGLREQYSINESPTFLSTTYSSNNFLRVDSTIASGIESGGRLQPSTFSSNDFERNTVRTGYPLGGQSNGGGKLPDIGAYEFDGLPNTAHAYSTSNVTHPTMLAAARNRKNQQILKMEVVTTGAYDLQSVTNFTLNANNTDNIADVDSAMLYYTGNVNSFDTFMYIGRVKPSIINYNIATNFKLQPGSNYFWLVYQTNDTVILADSIDAELVGVTVGGAVQTINAAPDKGREIKGPMCGNFTVGVAGNYTTITDLASELGNREVDTTCTIGVVCKLLDATYSTNETYPIVFDSIVGTGAGGRTITLKPASGVSATIVSSQNHSLVQFKGTRYFTVDGNNGNGQKNLTFNNNNSSPTAASIADVCLISYGTNLGAKYMTFKNTNFTSFTGSPNGTLNTASAGIATGTIATAVAAAIDIDNLTIDSCWFYNVAQAGVFQGATILDTLTITHNIVGHDDYTTNRGSYGFFITNAGVTYFNYNNIYNLISSSPVSFVNPYGVSIQNTLVGGLIEIKKNTFKSIRYERVTATGFGTAAIFVSPNVANSNVRIHNNSISDLTSSGNLIGSAVGSGIKGISIGGTVTSNVQVYNNSISLAGTVIRSGATNDKSACIFIDNVADSMYIYNNTTSNSIQNSTGIDTAFSFYCIAASSKLKAIDNNNYYVNATRSRLAFFLSAGAVNTLAAIKTASGQDTFSLSGNPKYNTSTNLRPQSTTNLFTAGKSLAVITDDLLGTTRSATPTIGAYEDTGDFAAPVITYTAFANSSNVATYNVNSNVKAIDPTPGTLATSCRVYYRKSTNANAWGGTNDNTTDGWKYVDATVSGIYFNIPIDHNLLYGGTASGDQIYYFVIAQDGKAIPNVSYLNGTLTSTPTSTTLTTEFPLTGSPDSYIINNAVTGWIDVGPSYPYKNLTGDTGVFKFINQNILGGNLHVRIRENLVEPGTHALNEISDSIGNSRVIIYPDSGGITRNITGYVAQAMIRISGADRVTFDGRDTATLTGKYLMFRNTHATNSTFKYLNDASYDTIEYCTVEGMNSSSISGVLYIGQGLANGADNLTFNNTDFRNRSDSAAAVLPNTVIYCEGQSIYILNDNINITNNNIYNFSNAGIFAANIGNGSGINITGNNFYFNHSTNATTSQFCINWAAGGLSGGNTINDNYFGGSTANCGGAAWTNASVTAGTSWNAIRITGNSVNSNILGNTIQNLQIPNAGNGPQFIGIFVNGSGEETIGSDLKPNIIGSASDTAGITVNTGNSQFGIVGTSTNNVRIRYNQIQGLKLGASTTAFTGIQVTGATGFDSIENNTIGASATVNSINHYGTSTVIGITAVKTFGSYVANNTIQSISTFGATQFQGINQSASNVGSNIYTIGNTIGSSTAANGIRLYGVHTGFYGLITSTVTGKSYISGNTAKGIQLLNNAATGQVTFGQFSGYDNYIYSNTFGELGATNSIVSAGNSPFLAFNNTNNDSLFFYGNTIAGVNMSNTSTPVFYGIYQATNNAYILDSGNMVGNPAVNGSITMAGSGFFFGLYNANSNTFGLDFKNNTIGGLTRSLAGGSYTNYMIYNQNSSNTVSGHKFRNNTIENLSFAGAATLYGIYTFGSATPSLGLQINDNSIKTIAFTHSSSSSSMYGIFPASGAPDLVSYNNTIGHATFTNNITMNEVGTFAGIYNSNATDTVMIYNNIVAGININNSATSPSIYGIYNSTTASLFLDSANTIGNTGVSGSITIGGLGTFYGHQFIGNPANGIKIKNNIVGGILRSGTGTYISYGIQNTDASNTNSAHNINNNTIQNMTFAGAATTYGIHSVSSSAVANNGGPGDRVYNNVIKTVSFTHSTASSLFYGIFHNNASDWLVYNNTIGDTSTTGNITMNELGTNGFAGIWNANTNPDTSIIYGNAIGGITINNSSTSPSMYGIGQNGATSTNWYFLDSANVVGNSNVNGSITINGAGAFYAHYMPATIAVSGTGHTIKNNSIGGLTRTGSGSANTYGIFETYAPASITSNNLVGNNTISNWSLANPGITTGIYCSVSAGRYSYIYNNTVKAITLTNAGSASSFSGIAFNAGKVNFTQPDSSSAGNNVVGDPNVSNSINSALNGPHSGISTVAASATMIRGNSVNNITATSSGTSNGIVGIAAGNGATAAEITSNTVKNLSCAGTSTNALSTGGSVSGIFTTSTSTMNVQNNIINGIALTSSGTTSFATGIDLYLPGATTVNSNRIFNLASNSNGDLSGLYFRSTNNTTHVIKNNQITIANGGNTNDALIKGIYADQAAATSTTQLYYNTVLLSGSVSSGSNLSTAYYRNSTTGNTNVLNNIFMNERTGGSGTHLAQWYGSGITNNRTNYNLNVTADSNNVARSSSTNYNLNAWRNGLQRDSSGWYAIAGTNVVADSMFIDRVNGDLGINTTTTEAWYACGKGLQTPGYADEYGNPASVRSTTIATGAPDIGSDEFTPTSEPDALFVKGPHTNNNTDSLMYGFRPVAYIYWKGGTLPTYGNLRYYTGTTPPDNTNNGLNPTAKYMNCYWIIAATGGTLYEYDINFKYDDALVGTLSSESNLRISRKQINVLGTWKAHIADATVNTSTNIMRLVNTTGFSVWTGSDQSDPLPLTLVSFTGKKQDKNVMLNWVTSFEEQMDGYEVEYSIDAQNFASIGFAKAVNNHFSECNYNLLHTSPVTGNNYYRLKTLESNGKFSYSNIVVVNFDDVEQMQIVIQPNPSKDQVSIVLQNQTQPALIQVFDMAGRLMFNEKVTLGQNITQVNLQNWNLGSYILRVTNEDGTSFVHRIMKVEE